MSENNSQDIPVSELETPDVPITGQAVKWVKRFKMVDYSGVKIPFESRKCTNKGVKMDDVWIPQVLNNNLEDLSELVELGIETEANIVARYKQGAAIQAQHDAKEGLSGKLTKVVSDRITNELTAEEKAELVESAEFGTALAALIKTKFQLEQQA